MVDFYTGLAATATRLLTGKGQTVTFTRRTVSAFNATTGTPTNTTTTFTGKGAVFDYNQSEVDGAVILSGDQRLILEAVTTAPIIGDAATVNSIKYRVMNVNTVNPGGTVVIYQLQLRK